MGIVWEQRIRHFNRKAKRREYRLVAASVRAARHRERMSLPSRGVELELAFERINIEMEAEGQPELDLAARRRALEMKLIRSRLLERKLFAKNQVRSRKITRDKTCIYLWQRRREWLAEAERNLAE